MLRFEQTFMDFLLQHQERHNRTYHFLILMEGLINAAKHIQQYYLTGALKGNLGLAGDVNVQGEDVMRMDQIAQEVTIHYLKGTGRVIHAISEEVKRDHSPQYGGRQVLCLFRSPGWFLKRCPWAARGFSLWHCQAEPHRARGWSFKAGKEYIAAGMFVIPTGTFTLALKDAGTWRFHIDETMNYVKPVQMVLPADTKSWELSFNESNRYTFAEKIQDWIAQNERKYAFRYLGALAGDFHRILTNGGMFMYPAIVNHPNPKKNRPQGKLRLMYEAAVVAFMCKEAGGDAVDETGAPILDIQPKEHHQRTALYVGSKPMVEEITQILRKD